MGSGRVTFHGRYTVRRTDIPCFAQLNTDNGVEGAAFSALAFFPGGAPKKRSDASNGFSSLWSAKLRSLPKLGSDILYTIYTSVVFLYLITTGAISPTLF